MRSSFPHLLVRHPTPLPARTRTSPCQLPLAPPPLLVHSASLSRRKTSAAPAVASVHFRCRLHPRRYRPVSWPRHLGCTLLVGVPRALALAGTKTVSDATEERVRESEKTQTLLAAAREAYRAVAVRGAIVYFCISDMSGVDPMYQYSLAYFKRLFGQCLRDAPGRASVAARVAELVEYQVRGCRAVS
jgi:hypothetical protein